jgi:hypothetical protein
MREIKKVYKEIFGIAILFIFSIILYFVIPEIPKYLPNVNPEAVETFKHLLLTVIAISFVHLIERGLFWRGVDKDKEQSAKEIFEGQQLVEAAKTCGLRKIYSSRRAVEEEIIEAVRKARRRVWLLGVGLSSNVHLDDELLTILKEKMNQKSRLDTKKIFEVRILLLDALRSMAVFRTILESSADDAKRILRTDRSEEKKVFGTDPYFNQRLYRDFEINIKKLKQVLEFRSAVRFYAHSPICWLAIIDNVAYYEPYTFGRSTISNQAELILGPLMPVFTFEKQIDTRPFEILEDHFKKLWATTDSDLFHIGGRVEDRKRLLFNIFKNRQEWFNHVYDVLHNPKKRGKDDERRYPRKPCESNVLLKVRWSGEVVSWKDGIEVIGSERVKEVVADIINFSYGGVALKLRENACPSELTVIHLDIHTEPNSAAGKHMINELLGPTNGKFVVVEITYGQDSPIVRAKAHTDI